MCMKKSLLLEKIVSDKMTASLILPFMSIHISLCLSLLVFPITYVHLEANMHFNTILFITHKAVITLLGISDKHCLLTLLVVDKL